MSKIPMTEAGFARLEEELKQLKSVERPAEPAGEMPAGQERERRAQAWRSSAPRPVRSEWRQVQRSQIREG